MATARPTAQGATPVLLLDLDLDGRVHRYATRAVEITRADGRVAAYRAGLEEPTWTAASTSIALSVQGGADDDSWTALVARGADLAAARGVLRRWYEGQVLEAAAVVLDGRIAAPAWGGADEPLDVSLEAEPWSESVVVPGPAAVVSESTWPVTASAVTDPAAMGASYPIVIGRPGGTTTITVSGTEYTVPHPGWLARLAQWRFVGSNCYLPIACHRMTATEVVIWDISDGVSEVRDVQYRNDNQGLRVAYVDFDGTTMLQAVVGHEYWVGIDPDGEPGAGGVPAYDRPDDCLRGAGEVLVYLLSQALFLDRDPRRTRLRVDVARQEAQRAYLDQFHIDAAISSQADVWEWIDAHLRPILPIEWVQGRRGGYFLAWRWDATAEDAVAHLDATGGGVDRVSQFEAMASSGNDFTLHYQPTGSKDYNRTAHLGAEAITDDGASSGSYLCAVSQGREQLRSGGLSGIVPWEHSSDVIAEDATAHRILAMLARRHACPPVRVVYQGGTELDALDRGDVVTLSDDEHDLDRRVCLVHDLEYDGSTIRVVLDMLADPTRRTRRTS